jgi:uncharacterized membrane protein YdjX (TVP38/TMEM64 family)
MRPWLGQVESETTARRDAAPAEPDRGRPAVPWLEIGLTLLGVAVLAALVLGIPALRHAAVAAVHGETTEVRHQINSLGATGPLLIIALTLIHSVAFYPAEIVNAAAGFAFGFFPAIAIVTVGWMGSAMLCYLVGLHVARPLLDRVFGRERFERVEATIERGGPTLLLAVRLIPIMPFSLVGYAAGAARVPLWRYFWTTIVGYMPVTALSVYFGTRLEGIKATDPLVIGAVVAMLALLGIGHFIVRRQAATTLKRPA